MPSVHSLRPLVQAVRYRRCATVPATTAHSPQPLPGLLVPSVLQYTHVFAAIASVHRPFPHRLRAAPGDAANRVLSLRLLPLASVPQATTVGRYADETMFPTQSA